MKTLIKIIIIGLFLNCNTGFAQEVDNPQEELLQTTWNLRKIVFEDVDYYFLSTPSLDQVVLEINPPVQGNEGFDLLTNFCDAGSGWLIFEEENEFYMTYFGYGILAKNMSDIDFCNLPFPEEVEGYVTEELYIDEFFWNEEISSNPDGYPYSFHYTYTIELKDSLTELRITNENNITAYFQSEPFYLSVESTSFSQTSLYPNPVNDQLTIDNLTTEAALTLYDLSGKKLFSEVLTEKSIELNLSFLAEGMYIYRLEDKQGNFKTGKLVKN